MANDSGSVVTVTGRIDPDELGLTITHEHLFMDGTASGMVILPETAQKREIAKSDFAMEDLWFIKRNPMRHVDNMMIGSIDEAVDEVAHFYRQGGGTLVEVTPKLSGEDPEAVRAVALETGVQMVKGTAYYYPDPAPPELGAKYDRLERMDASSIRDEFISDVEEGFGQTDVRAGLIGEIGISQMSDTEIKILRAAAQAALKTGAPLSIHPPLHYGDHPASHWSLEILDIIEEEGLPLDRVIMCHQDYSDEVDYPGLKDQKEIADRGAFIEFDLWGWEMYIDSQNHAAPTDNWRIRATRDLIEQGYGTQMLFSHDIYMKVQRRKYGGNGYAHILENVVPMLRSHGVSSEAINEILLENPKKILAFADPE